MGENIPINGMYKCVYTNTQSYISGGEKQLNLTT